MQSSPSFFEAFIKDLSKEQQEVLRQVRVDIFSAAPTAEESVSSGVPAFKYKDRYLVSLNASKDHLSFFMMRGNALKELQNELQGFKTTKVKIEFTPDKPIPTEIIEKAVSARIKEIEQSQIKK